MKKILAFRIIFLLLAIAIIFLPGKFKKSKVVVETKAQTVSAESPKTPDPIVPITPIIPIQPTSPPTSLTSPTTTTSPKPKAQPTPKPAPMPPPPAPAPAPAPPPPQPVTCESGGFNAQFLCLLNEYRKSKGLNALVYDAALNATAADHSAWMNATGTMSHIGEGSTTFTQRCEMHGAICDAENIAMGFTTAQKLFDAWQASPGHNANMLGSHSKLGLGLSGVYSALVLK
ncbi:MAG: CAP domain-containing protein [Candidatus Doudnabacteria bacterium]|nr:CAP domain-containing protein [Candidatus Doudnabacteria bacterium]